MRICVISNADIEKFYGATTRPYYISESLVKHGCDVLHICKNPPNQSETVDYMPIRYYNYKLGIIRRVMNFIRLYKVCRNFSPDILYVHQMNSAVVSLLLQWLTKTPFVYDAHSSIFLEIDTYQNVTSYKKIKWGILEKFACMKCKKIISASNITTEYLLEKYNIQQTKIHTIEVGVNCNQFSPNLVENDIKKKTKISDINKVVLFTCPRDASNPSNNMALEYFFNMIPEIELKYKNIKFLILGGGEQILPPSNNVMYTGFVEDLPKYINLADVCIMPYPEDAVVGGTRNKLIEYFACGKPVVSTSEGIRGFDDVLPNKHYLLANNSDEFVQKILLILDDPEISKNLGENAREFALKYDWDGLSSQILDVFNEVVKPIET